MYNHNYFENCKKSGVIQSWFPNEAANTDQADRRCLDDKSIGSRVGVSLKRLLLRTTYSYFLGLNSY